VILVTIKQNRQVQKGLNGHHLSLMRWLVSPNLHTHLSIRKIWGDQMIFGVSLFLEMSGMEWMRQHPYSYQKHGVVEEIHKERRQNTKWNIRKTPCEQEEEHATEQQSEGNKNMRGHLVKEKKHSLVGRGLSRRYLNFLRWRAWQNG